MIVKFQDREWEFDPERITIKQAIAIQLEYGWALEEYEKAAADADPRGIQCMYWLMLQQNGVTRPIRECDADVVALATAWAEAFAAERASRPAPEPEPELDPTRQGGPPSAGPGSPTDTTPPPSPAEGGQPTES